MKDVVEGYPPAMPPFQGRITDEEIDILTQWMKNDFKTSTEPAKE